MVWLLFSSVLGLFYAVIRWGNLNIDRDFARFFSWGVLKGLGIRVKIEGREYLETAQPCIYAVNHQSGFDMATLGPIYPKRTVLIGKKEVVWVPLFGLFYVAAGNILINRSRSAQAIAELKKVVDAISEKGVSVWIFPEGTRNRGPEGIQPFKKGAFHMALQAGVPIVPIVSGPLNRLVSWSDKRFSRGTLRVKVLPPIYPQAFKDRPVEEFSDAVRSQMQSAFSDLQ